MEIHRWWHGDPEQRYWLEITDRETLGENLHAPQLDHRGRETWSYSLVLQARPGDIVFHWWKHPEATNAITGYSTVAGPMTESTIVWKAHGSAARFELARPRASWLVPLTGYQELPHPITLDQLRHRETELHAIRTRLENRHGKPTYFPWVFMTTQPLRTAQAYLAKLPAEAVELLTGSTPTAQVGVSDLGSDPDPGTGRQTDPKVRKAIEEHAVNKAIQYLTDLDYSVDDVGSRRSYDLHATLDATTVHVEVKGTSGTATAVNLTKNEVQVARTADTTLLYVVDKVFWTPRDDEIEVSGGRDRYWWNWRAEEERLTATEYRYELPPEGDDNDPPSPQPNKPSSTNPGLITSRSAPDPTTGRRDI